MSIKSPLSHKNQEPENGVLYVVGTPIGNLSDISLRAIEILKKVSLIFCEDTRQTNKLLQKYHFKNHLISFNKNNFFKKIPTIIDNLKNKKSIALVSDAGMPSISDPGEELIKEIRKIGLKVICIPGPSAVLTAIVSSGFPSSKFIFEGFLPKKKKERDEILSEISQNNKTTILFESPYRIKKLLYDLKEYCGGEREIFICRELTKKFEENIGSSINEIIDVFENRVMQGEFTILIKGISKEITNDYPEEEIKHELLELVKAGLSLSSASKYLAKKKNISKRFVYNLY
tara:strand:+ start:943 stop:1806 length:864 start_codon:yes stop_codon:yes gene_type:complete